jgi:steroid delta-isomerase-like uncharacterized protein
MSPAEIKKLIRRNYDELLSQGKLELADQLYSRTAVIHDPATPGLPIGPAAIKQLAQHYLAAFPDCKYVIEDIIVENDRACVRWTASATHQGPIMGIAPTGKFASVTGLALARFENDRIAEVWTHWDVLGMLKEMGVELPIKTELEAVV